MAGQETPAPGQAPPTRLDSEPPPTSLDGAAPPTSLDGGAPPTVLDSATTAGADTYVRLPQPLRADYEALRDMASGGEGDLLLTRYRPTEELRVVKIYRGDRRRDAEALSLLARADPAHVVVIYDSGQHAGRWWEAMEYCEHGSLTELIRSEGPKLSPQRIREVIEDVTGALEHLHSLKIPHRDLKPANIMVRTLEPLDLVLADFGLARRLDLSKEMHSRLIVSAAYASPQTASGAISPAMDWWSLGIILAELCQGRNSFQLPNGEWLPDQVIMDWISSRPIDLSGIEDERLRNLCRGLTTRDDRKGQRWGSEEVRAWLAGENPQVATESESTTTSPKSASPFPFKDPTTSRTRPFTDPRELARALALEWEGACALLAGTAAHRAEQRALRNFLRSLSLSEAEQILAEQDDVEERLVRLLVELDPATPPTFRGFSVDRQGLLSLAQAEGEGEQAALAALYSERILLDYSRAQGQAELAEIDAAWHEEVSRFEQTLDRARADNDTPLLSDQREHEAALASARSRVLAALLDEEARQQTLGKGAEAAQNESPRRAGWFTALAGLKGREDDSLGWALALALLRPIAERLADQREREEAERERERAEKEAAERERVEREARINSGLATSADLDEIAREASSEIATQDPSVVRQVWAHLVATGAVGTPTHDVLEVHVKGKPPRLSLTELSRVPAWLAPNVRQNANQHQDVWVLVDGDGTVWAPYEDGDLERSLYRGRADVWRYRALRIAVAHETGLRTHKYGRRIELVEGVVVTYDGSRNAPFPTGGHGRLREAVWAILRARGRDYPPAPAH